MSGNAPKVLRGSCFCSSVSYQVTGEPTLRAFCHCTGCQRLSGSAFIHTIHYRSTSFAWTHSTDAPLDKLDVYQNEEKPWKTRFRCKRCGVCVTSHNAQKEENSVWGTQLERDEKGAIKNFEWVKPTAHIFYDTRIVDVADDLGKWDGYEDKSNRIM